MNFQERLTIMYCRHCGQTLGTQAVFCTHCGSPANVSGGQPFSVHPSAKPVKQKKPLSPRKKRIIRVGIAVSAVIFLGLVVWQAGHLTGQWQRMALNRAMSAWERYDDRSEVEDAVMTSLNEMADLLERGQISAALDYVHSDQKERYASDFARYPEQIPILVSALRSANLVLISDELDAYETDRMVRVELQIPDDANSAGQDEALGRAFTITMVLDEERWVIDS